MLNALRRIAFGAFASAFAIGGLGAPASALTAPRTAIISQAQKATLKPLTNRLFVPNQYGGSGNAYIWAHTRHISLKTVTCVPEVWYPNWRATSGLGTVAGGAAEVAAGAAATGTETFTYTDATSGTATTINMLDDVGGTIALTGPDGGYIAAHGTQPVTFVAGAPVILSLAANFPAGMVYSQHMADLANGEVLAFGGSPYIVTSTYTNSYAAGLSYYGPIYIGCVGGGNWVVATIMANSRGQGLGDVANDLYGNIGTAPRFTGQRVPSLNLSVPGDTAADFALASQNPRRVALAKAVGGVLFYGLGVNNTVFQNRTIAQWQADTNAILAQIAPPRVVLETIDPVTTGNFSTVDYPAREPVRTGINALVRASPYYLDPAIVLESSGSPGTWASATYVSSDFTHESNVGNATAMASGAGQATAPAAIGNAPVIPVIVPTAWDPANKGSVTLSNGNLTSTWNASSPFPSVRGTSGHSTGKYFFSTTIVTGGTSSSGVGMVASTFTMGSGDISGTGGLAYYGSGGIYSNGGFVNTIATFAAGAVVDEAIDLGAKLAWFRVNGGNWNNSGTANPATGVGGIAFNLGTGATIYPALSQGNNPSSMTADFGATTYPYAAPSGFSNW